MRTGTQLAPCAALLLLTLGLQGCAFQDRQTSRRENAGTANESGQHLSSDILRLNLGSDVTMELVRIPAGEFLMGSPASEEGRHAHEGPQHAVRIAKVFYLGRHEVTQAEWRAVMGDNPSFYRGDDVPVNRVSWSDAQEFCRRCSQRVGRRVHLPGEAEWEYACRAGSTTAYSFGESSGELEHYAWYEGHSRRAPNPAEGKQPNAWGLYDMHGNVWEWCEDAFQHTYDGAPTDGSAVTAEDSSIAGRVLRGGSWFDKAVLLRSAERLQRSGALRSGYVGFRVVVGTD